MTYSNLKKLLQSYEHNTVDIDLVSRDIKSKIILCVGDRAHISSSYLSSIMAECKISHSRYTNDPALEIKNRFFTVGERVDIGDICYVADIVRKKVKSNISRELFLINIALLLFESSEFILIDISLDLYLKICESIVPEAVLFTDEDDQMIGPIIKSSPKGTREIISASKCENYDFFSQEVTDNGVHVSYASRSKITPYRKTALGLEFFYFDKPYRISSKRDEDMLSAQISIESARAIFGVGHEKIFLGLDKIILPKDKNSLII